MSEPYKYAGSELELFQHARNWKRYFASIISRYIKGAVLEIGAGLGETTVFLNRGKLPTWQLLEPDGDMADVLEEKISKGKFPPNTGLTRGTIEQVNRKFDTIIYIDVLEHIENDQSEIEKAAGLLEAGGHLIVLSPAFKSLFSPFDKAIGHCRRYNKEMMIELTPPSLKIVKNGYYDSMGYFASLVNKLFLRKKYPSIKEVLFWDRFLIPVSRITDRILFFGFGKTIITAWQKKGTTS